jgi:hypothetical protein
VRWTRFLRPSRRSRLRRPTSTGEVQVAQACEGGDEVGIDGCLADATLDRGHDHHPQRGARQLRRGAGAVVVHQRRALDTGQRQVEGKQARSVGHAIGGGAGVGGSSVMGLMPAAASGLGRPFGRRVPELREGEWEDKNIKKTIAIGCGMVG